MLVSLPDWYAAKPVASVADLGTGGEWIDLSLSAAEVELFRAATGCELPPRGIPQGVVPMLGRLAYLSGRRAPPGGILARLRWTNHSRLPADGRIRARSGVVVDYEKRGRRRLDIQAELAHPDGRPIATTVWELIWPEGAP